MDCATTIVSIIIKSFNKFLMATILLTVIFFDRVHKIWLTRELTDLMNTNKSDDTSTENVNNILLDLNWCSDSVYFFQFLCIKIIFSFVAILIQSICKLFKFAGISRIIEKWIFSCIGN